MALNLGWDNGKNRDRARSVFDRLNQMRWLISHLTADTGGSLLLLELVASRPTKIVLRLLIKSAATLKLAKEDAADTSADQERCYAKLAKEDAADASADDKDCASCFLQANQ